MAIVRGLFTLKGIQWSLFSLIVLTALSGCTEPFVKVTVQVDTCPSGGQREPIPDPGVCSLNPTNPYVGPLIPSNHKVCKNVNNQTIACTGNEQCTGGRVCNTNPGTEGRITCKSVWKESAPGSMSGTCTCTHLY
jgi:hypothetical protein